MDIFMETDNTGTGMAMYMMVNSSKASLKVRGKRSLDGALTKGNSPRACSKEKANTRSRMVMFTRVNFIMARCKEKEYLNFIRSLTSIKVTLSTRIEWDQDLILTRVWSNKSNILVSSIKTSDMVSGNTSTAMAITTRASFKTDRGVDSESTPSQSLTLCFT